MTPTGTAFGFVCDVLRPGFAIERSNELRRGLDWASQHWPDVVAIVNKQYVVPAFFRSLEAGELLDAVPAVVRDFLAAAAEVNALRNSRIRQQAVEISSACAEAGIETVLLKGGATLFDASTQQRDERMIVDLDILVRRETLQKTVAVCESLGYQMAGDPHGWSYHYPPLARVGEPAFIELHQYVGSQRDLLPPEAVFDKAVRPAIRESTIRIPSPEHRAIHNVFHSEIQDRHHWLGVAALRPLLDLTRLCLAYGDKVDWHAVAHAFSRQGWLPELAGYLALANRLLGLPLPSEVSGGAAANRHVRRCLLQAAHPGLTRALAWAAAATHPFARHVVTFQAQHSGRKAWPWIERAREGGRILAKYRFGILKEIRDTYDTFYANK
jgi:hypothetical protein